MIVVYNYELFCIYIVLKYIWPFQIFKIAPYKCKYLEMPLER